MFSKVVSCKPLCHSMVTTAQHVVLKNVDGYVARAVESLRVARYSIIRLLTVAKFQAPGEQRDT